MGGISLSKPFGDNSGDLLKNAYRNFTLPGALDNLGIGPSAGLQYFTGIDLNPFGGGANGGDALSQIALDQYNQTQPLRTSLIGQYGNILNGSPNLSTAFTGAYGPARAGIEDQYSQARNQILESSDARGGQLSSGLQNASLGRARAVSDLQGNIIQNAVNNAQNLSVGLGAQSMGALGQAGALQNQAQGQNWNQKMQLGQGFGQMIGSSGSRGGSSGGKNKGVGA